MPKEQLLINDFSGGLNTYQVDRDLKQNELASCQNFTFQKKSSLVTRGAFVTHGDIGSTHAATISGGYGLFSFESDYSPVAYEAVDTSQSTNIIFENSTGSGAGFSADASVGTFVASGSGVSSAHSNSGLKDTIESNIVPGNQIVVKGTAKNNGIYTVLGVADSATGDTWPPAESNLIEISIPESGKKFADETIAANVTTHGTISIKTHSLGESIIVLSDVSNGNLDVYSKSADAFETAAIITKQTSYSAASISPEYGFYAVDNVLRVSDGKDIPELQRIIWYGYVNRHHFRGIQYSNVDINASKSLYKGWYEQNNKLSPPTAGRTDTSNTYPTADNGFSIDYDSTNANDNSTWSTETWKIALSFIYDGNQESLLYVPTSSNTFTTVEGNDLRLRVMAQISSGYGARISGGHMYFKASDSDEDPWVLLCDIDLVDGVSGALYADKIGWTAASATTLYSDITALRPNLDTFETINGYSPDVSANSLGQYGEGWKTSVIANRHAFIANVKVKNDYDDNITAYGDRIMYSLPNKFDTFPSFNFIDVVKGDAEAYIKLESFADRLIALKHNSCQIINISSPSATNWFLEENIKNNGVSHPAAVFRCSKGILWANKRGFYLYNGSKIINLIDNKIDQSDWSSFITNYSIVGYDANSDMAIIIRDAETSGATQGDAYIFDFKTNAWSFHTDLLTASADNYTNFVTDYNGDLVIGVQNSSNIDIKKFSHTTTAAIAADSVSLVTKDFDFGSTALKKKIYAVTVTYKSDAAQTTPISIKKDGSGSYAAMTGNFIDTGSAWKRLRATITPFTCQSLAIRIRNETNTTVSDDYGLQIGDISIEYRTLRSASITTDT